MTVLPTVSGHITGVSLTPRYKTIFSSASLNTDCKLTSKNPERFIDLNVRKNIKYKLVRPTEIYCTKYLGKNVFALKTKSDIINSQPPLDNIVTENYESELNSYDDEMEKNIKVVKHVHHNSICAKGPESIVKKEDLPLLLDFSEGGCSNKPNTTDYLRSKQHSDDLTANIHSLSNLKV